MPYYIDGSVTLGIWALKSGVWQKVTTVDVPFYQQVGGYGQYTVNFDETFSLNLGPGVQAFGVTVDSHTGTAASLTDFVSATWTGTSASGERSATPGGEQSTVTVRPQ